MEEISEAVQQPKTGGARLKKSNKTPAILGGVLLAVVLLAYLGLGWYANSSPKFWPRTHILGQDVSGMTEEEAVSALSAVLPEIGLFIYDMPEEDRFYDASMADDDADAPPHTILSLAEMGVNVDPAAVVRAAYDAQHGGSLLGAGRKYLSQYTGRTVLVNYTGASTYRIDEAKLAAAAESAAQALSYPALDTAYSLTDSAIRIQAPKDGRQVDEAALLARMQDRSWIRDLSLKAPCSVLPAKVLTAQDIHDAVFGEMKNAGYDAATDTITPEQIGADFDVAAAQAALDGAAPGEVLEIPADIQYPTVTAEALKGVLFRDVLGEAKTKVGGTSARKGNVRLSASSINGLVLNTGDVFSYNESVGQRTAANGYQPAPAYVKGETVDEIGGGICQTSSTLYLACMRGNLAITERYAHRYIPSYIAAGMDATVSWGGPDYKFTNDTDYPIKIVTSYEGEYLTVKLLGTNVTGITAKVTNESLSSTPFEVVYEEDPTLAPGTEKVKTTPYTGSKWRTYRHLYDKDGKLLSSEYEATSDYKARNKVILRGPALPEVPTTPEVPAVNPTPVTEEPSQPATPHTPETPEEPVVETPEAPPEEIPVIVIPESAPEEAA